MVNQLSKEVKRVLEERNSIRADIALYENENLRLQQEVDLFKNLRDELEEGRIQLQESEISNEELRNRVESLQSKIDEHVKEEKKNGKLKEESQALEKRYFETKSALDELRVLVETLNSQKQDVEKALKEEQEKQAEIARERTRFVERIAEMDFLIREKGIFQ